MIHDKKTNKVVVLDKEKKKGWEGLTFPGGHLEMGESIYESCLREVFEETGLRVTNLDLKGLVHWESSEEDLKEVGFLYYTDRFEGDLIESCHEGSLSWMDLEEFIGRKDKSDSMDQMLRVYLDDHINEAMAYVTDKELNFKFY